MGRTKKKREGKGRRGKKWEEMGHNRKKLGGKKGKNPIINRNKWEEV